MIEEKSYLYVYKITRDFGFAPNPFYGLCTLATCKPNIRSAANVGDWVLGVGGIRMVNVSRKCIFLMKVTGKIDFQEYWDNPEYSRKKSLRNGSRLRMLGDNIYHKDAMEAWIQEDSHHSNPDGSTNLENLNRDTGKTDKVLLSEYFLYFGSAAIMVDLDLIGFHNRIRDFKKIDLNSSSNGRELIESTISTHRYILNVLISDPCQFMDSHKRVDQVTGKFT